ncbi:substrate-binding domain-containing protein [Vibrio sp. PP-XX7]
MTTLALGAIQALQAAGKLKSTLVVGVDATPDGLTAVKNGTLDATVFQDGSGQARAAIDVAVDAVKGQPHERDHMDPCRTCHQRQSGCIRSQT